MRFSRSNTFYGDPLDDVSGWAEVITQNVAAHQVSATEAAVFMWLSPEDNTWWYVEVTLDDYQAVTAEPMDIAEDEPTNTYALDDNCYYCTAAALRGITVDKLITETELMQYAGGATVPEVDELFAAAGLSTAYTEYSTFDEVQQAVVAAADDNDKKFALCFVRADGSGHAVVVSREQGQTKFLDYQPSEADDAHDDVSQGATFLLYPQ
ncbi:hypothetical protein [Alloactinosynnema sp. L-07]|uniref:hypothetical protein n=1 Tax=Alloactinosynnema sp. L-07 TaxID=1653480 RepID=UPI00065F07F2|nr:hypothetical protein [Alloactinosynnema sp. L-07]CRK59890.1 hypothetical protein [Alloactinosynnema sp. L-07]